MRPSFVGGSPVTTTGRGIVLPVKRSKIPQWKKNARQQNTSTAGERSQTLFLLAPAAMDVADVMKSATAVCYSTHVSGAESPL